MIPHFHLTPYDKAVHAGGAQAIGEMKKGPDGKPAVDLLWKPPEESAPEGQVKAAQGLIKTGIAALIVSPDDEKTLAAITAAAAAGRVPVIAVGISFNSEGCKSAINFDEHKAAELAAPFGGKARIVGSADDPEEFLPGLKSGDISALILPDPLATGYQSVKTAVDCIKEKKVEKQIDIPLHVATKDNLEDPAIAVLLHPPVANP
jgi:ABC-type sugar transport system substrate-binding protein